MVDNTSMESLDFKQFSALVDIMPDVVIYDKAGRDNASKEDKEIAGLAENRIKKEFHYLLGLRQPSMPFLRARYPELDNDVYLCAVDHGGSQPCLAGVCLIKHFRGSGLHPLLVEYMEGLGSNTPLIGYDCTTVTSVARSYQGQGISTLMRLACVDLMVERHAQRGGQGPALMKMTSLSNMGNQRLLTTAQRIAASRDDIVLAYGGDEQERLGLWMDNPGMTRPVRMP